MNKALVVVAMIFGLNVSVAYAQHENMPGHDNMSPGEHDNMPKGGHGKHGKKKPKPQDGDADKQDAPKTDDAKHKGHDTP